MSDNGAPGSDGGNTGGDAGGQQQQGTGDGAAFDFSQILEQHKAEIERSGKTVESLRGELGRTHETMDRVKRAFTGDNERPVSPYQARIKEFQELGEYVDKEVGHLPATAKIGKQLAALGQESEARAERLERELADLKETLKRQDNPAIQGLERAAHIMEGMLQDGLEKLYGSDDRSEGIRSAQFDAVSRRINDEIKDLIKNDPKSLLKLQRNPKLMRNMVNQFTSEMLPPRVREMMEQESARNAPITTQDLYASFNEAKGFYEQAQEKGDAKAVESYSNLMDSIRQEILASKYGGRGGTAEKPTLSRLYSGSR